MAICSSRIRSQMPVQRSGVSTSSVDPTSAATDDEPRRGVAHHLGQIHHLELQLQLARADPRHVEQVVDQVGEPLHVPRGHADVRRDLLAPAAFPSPACSATRRSIPSLRFSGVSGVRSSWLATERNSSRSRIASCASS